MVPGALSQETIPMRRYWLERRPPGMFRGAELPRLASGLVMLAVLYQLIVWASNSDTWRWWVKEGNKSASAAQQAGPPTPKPTPKLPPATGPTDEDPDQAETAREELQAVTDGSLTLGPEEMEPYDRLVFWVKNQSLARLRQRARSDLLFTNFYDEANKYRGQLVTLEMNVRRILDAGKNREGTQLYEVWGFTTESRDRLYVAIVVDLPKGMPIEPSVYEKARFTGYFFKLQGYHASGARPDAVPDRSPLLIGRLEWQPAAVAAPPLDNTQEWTWGLSLLAVIGAILVLRWGYVKWLRPRPAARSTIPDAASGEAIPIETWLERSSFHGTGDEEQSKIQEDVLYGNGKPG
jgi:hypothetical protein